MGEKSLLDVFKCSFFYVWFSELDDELLESMLSTVENTKEAKLYKMKCPATYEEYITYSLVAFLLTFTHSANSFNYGSTTFKSLNDTQSFIKEHSVGSTVRTVYQQLNENAEKRRVGNPFRYIDDYLKKLEEGCLNSAKAYIRYGSNINKARCY